MNKKDFGLYRDDGLRISRNTSGPEADRKRKNIIKHNIIAVIPKAISKHLTSISCKKNVFDRNVDIYQTALKNSGFDGKITYNDQSEEANNANIETPPDLKQIENV